MHRVSPLCVVFAEKTRRGCNFVERVEPDVHQFSLSRVPPFRKQAEKVLSVLCSMAQFRDVAAEGVGIEKWQRYRVELTR